MLSRRETEHFCRSKNDALYRAELDIWDASTSESFAGLPALLANMSLSMQTKFVGKYGVIKAKLKKNVFVEKL